MTINAGTIDIVAMCQEKDAVMNTSITYQATFHFDAQAGHEYEISPKCDGCFRLLNVTANEAIAKSPYKYAGPR